MSEAITRFSSGNEQVLSLAKMISEATDNIVKIYSDAGAKIPALESTDSGPFDEVGNIPPVLLQQLRILEAACGQLNATINSPAHIVTSRAYQFEESALFQFITETKIADYLVDKPKGVHATELGEKTGVDAGKLARILRFLANKHIFTEVEHDVFAHNRLSLQLISTNAISSLVGLITYELLRSTSCLTKTLKDPKLTSSSLPTESIFEQAFGVSFFGFYDSPEGRPRRELFNQAMVGWGDVTGIAHQLPTAYPWGSFPEGSAICDVGGSNGHVTCEVAKKVPSIRVIVQDLPSTVTQAKEYWNQEYPEAIQQQRVEFVPLDFFKESPVPDCQFYFVRHVLHDWPDAECLTILKSVRKAMGPSSKLIINEIVLQDGIRDYSKEARFEQAPEPLLPNYGLGRIRPYEQDMNMLISLNSKERTLEEFIDMGEKSGLKFEKLYDAGATTSLVVFTPVA